MHKPNILVSGATGKTGGAVVAELVAAGFPVRAMVRRQDDRSRALAARGVEVIVADMGDPLAVAAALRGVQRAYVVPPFDPAALQAAAVFAGAVRDARLEHVVLMSQWLASPAHPALATRQHWLTDRLFRLIPDIGLTILNPGFFADLPYLAVMPYAAHLGIFPWPFGEGRNAPPSVDDIGRVAAAALMDPGRHAGRTYRPTGPELLSGPDMAAVLGRVLGRKVRLAAMSTPLFLKAAKLDGFPELLLAMLPHYVEEHRRGAFAVGAPNDDVREVTGRAPERFEQIAARHAALPRNRRSVAASWRQFGLFTRVPLTAAPPLRAFEAGLRLPGPAKPAYVQDSAVWCAEHRVDDRRRESGRSAASPDAAAALPGDAERLGFGARIPSGV